MDPFDAAPDLESGLEEAMWKVQLDDDSGLPPSQPPPAPAPPAYPERPGQPPCAYYMRTGSCGFGDSCRYHHPPRGGTVSREGRTGSMEHSQGASRPACRYFLRNRSCNYGDACRFEHLAQDGSAPAASINKYGYRLRPGEKDCSYYVKTGHCKYGLTCKFNHPEAFGANLRLPAPASSPVPQPAQQYPVVASLDVAGQSMLTSPYMQGAYGPVLLLPGLMPELGWCSCFPASASHQGAEQQGWEQTVVAQEGSQYGAVVGDSPYGLGVEFSRLNYDSAEYYPSIASLASSSTDAQAEHMLPDRLDKPFSDRQRREQTIAIKQRHHKFSP